MNIGDLLLGEGYRLIAECGAGDSAIARMLAIAANGHRTLCLGQGDELTARGRAAPAPSARVLEIFRRKTSPAFEVALRLGASCAGADETEGALLSEYSDALGIAYQIQDDIEDAGAAGNGADAQRVAAGVSLLASLAYESAPPEQRLRLAADWKTGAPIAIPDAALAKARQLLEHRKNAAIRSLNASASAPLKGLLTRLAKRILNPR